MLDSIYLMTLKLLYKLCFGHENGILGLANAKILPKRYNVNMAVLTLTEHVNH